MNIPRGRDLTDFQRGQIYSLRFHARWTISRISQTLNLNNSAVKKYCQRVPEKELEDKLVSTDRKRKCGRSKCTTARNDRINVTFEKNKNLKMQHS